MTRRTSTTIFRFEFKEEARMVKLIDQARALLAKYDDTGEEENEDA